MKQTRTILPQNRLPDTNNIYRVIAAAVSKHELAKQFQMEGWTVRKTAWADFEVLCEWSELYIEGENEILIYGQ